ncbi:hypothetical protein CEXT_513491 [Caerostris extrusa]|uniref:Uncharacterized protein n=1 Tax=Caerostris extrusa TaxID=172846 RepID=A0AAV4U6I6_CAEEX|nr:hypothetical protein CEXT_513491 [Caerostris extrusa]
MRGSDDSRGTVASAPLPAGLDGTCSSVVKCAAVAADGGFSMSGKRQRTEMPLHACITRQGLMASGPVPLACCNHGFRPLARIGESRSLV